jgi:hypothetical protein
MEFEKVVTLKNGTSHTFTFTHDTIRKFEQMGGKLSEGIDNISTNMSLYIRACIIDEGSMSDSKAKKILDAIGEDYDLPDCYGVLANAHAEVFTGGDEAPQKLKLSEMK